MTTRNADLSALLGECLPAAEIDAALSDEQARYLADHRDALASVSEVWRLMDEEWDRNGAGYAPADRAALDSFYRSPVWLLNGLFTESDAESIAHREAIARFVASLDPATVVDYGGGFGSLSRRLAEILPSASVTLVEPFPTELARACSRRFANLSFAAQVTTGADVAVAQDVLEHVTDPLALFGELLGALRPGGTLVTANCFQPLIKCHYPGALHFQYTFRRIAPLLGCRFAGRVLGAPHAEIYVKTAARPRTRIARLVEGVSRALYPLLSRIKRARS